MASYMARATRRPAGMGNVGSHQTCIGASAQDEWSISVTSNRNDPKCREVTLKDASTGEMQTLEFSSDDSEFVRRQLFQTVRELNQRALSDGRLYANGEAPNSNDSSSSPTKRVSSFMDEHFDELKTGNKMVVRSEGENAQRNGDAQSPGTAKTKLNAAKNRWTAVKTHVIVNSAMDKVKNVYKEVKKKHQIDRGVFHPLEPWRLCFDYALAVLIVYSVIVVPYRIAFDVPAQAPFWLAFELSIDGFFFIDIFLS